MALPLISLIHPTRRVLPSEGFPRGWRDAHDAWLEKADHPENIEYVLSVHESRWEEFHNQGGVRLLSQAWNQAEAVINAGRDCNVDNLNRAAQASTGKLLTGVMDDYYPPEHWDTLLLEAICGGPVPNLSVLNLPFVLVCSTGATPERDLELMIGGAMTRPVYQRRGYILDPDFESMYADNWWAFENRRDEKAGLLRIIERLDIQFEHRRLAMDEAYAQQNRPQAYRDGYITFQRKAFGKRVIAYLIPGETFSHRVLFGHLEANDFLRDKGFIVERYGLHSSNVYSTRIELSDAVLAVGAKADFVLWSDDDNVISPANLDMLIADAEKHPDIGIFTGWCWCAPSDYQGEHVLMMSCGRQGEGLKCLPFSVEDFCRMKAQGKLAVTSDDIAPDVFWSGFPLVLMRGSVLEKLGWESFQPMLGKYRRGFTSEDTTFFYRANQAGIKSAVDLRVEVDHLKLRPLRPTILPAQEREKVMEYLKSVERQMEASAAD